jgi:hypothetical protein
MALDFAQPLTAISTRNRPGSRERPARKADSLTAMCDPLVDKIWERLRSTTLWGSTAYYRNKCEVRA